MCKLTDYRPIIYGQLIGDEMFAHTDSTNTYLSTYMVNPIPETHT